MLITAGLHQYIKNTKVSQQSFVVTGRGNNINLNPAFLSGTKYFINIPDSHKLHLKASRNGVQNDDKLKYIQEAVSNKIITYITNKKLNKESIFKYLNEGRGNAINFQCELNFLANLKVFDLLEKVTLPKIAYNQKLVSFHDISNKLNHDSKEYKIAVIKKNYFENNFFLLKQHFSQEVYNLMSQDLHKSYTQFY